MNNSGKTVQRGRTSKKSGASEDAGHKKADTPSGDKIYEVRVVVPEVDENGMFCAGGGGGAAVGDTQDEEAPVITRAMAIYAASAVADTHGQCAPSHGGGVGDKNGQA